MSSRSLGTCCRSVGCSRSLPRTAESCSRMSCSPTCSVPAGAPVDPGRCGRLGDRAQTLHSLSDTEAAEAVTFDLRWKAACGLAVTAKGFDPTVLTYWRRRLAVSQRPNRIFEVVKPVVAETGVLAAKTRRALDSTVLDDAVTTQDTITQLIASVRRVAREVPGAAEVITQRCTAHDDPPWASPRSPGTTLPLGKCWSTG